MKNELLTFLEDREQSQEHFYGFKEHWRSCRDLLNVHYRSLLSTYKAITRPGKRDATFQQSYEDHQHQPWGIPYQAVGADYVKKALSLMLHDEYQTPHTPEHLVDQIEILYHCFSYFSKNLDYLPLNVHMKLDYILMEISFFVGGAISAGGSVGVGYDKKLKSTGKSSKTKLARREEVVKPEVIDFLKNYLNQVDPSKHFERFHAGQISDRITKDKKSAKESKGFGIDVVIEITREYFKEKGLKLPWKKYGKVKK